MPMPHIPIWKEAPFIRLIIPFIGGIMMEWYVSFTATVYWMIMAICLALVFLFEYINSFIQFRYYYATGVLINFLLMSFGDSLPSTRISATSEVGSIIFNTITPLLLLQSRNHYPKRIKPLKRSLRLIICAQIIPFKK